MARDKEAYRKRPIFGTDFSKPISVLVEEAREKILEVRGLLNDLEYGSVFGERIVPVAGLLTCGLVTLHSINKEIVDFEIKTLDHERGPSMKFGSRGVGLDMCPGCFVCGSTVRHEGSNSYLNNIAAFVASKEDGEKIVGWFGRGAFLDLREREPNWIQVKIGACDKHMPNLQMLHDLTKRYGVIREVDVSEAMTLAEAV